MCFSILGWNRILGNMGFLFFIFIFLFYFVIGLLLNNIFMHSIWMVIIIQSVKGWHEFLDF